MNLITILILGLDEEIKIENKNSQAYEAKDFLVHKCIDSEVFSYLSSLRPHVIFTFGDIKDFPILNTCSIEWRKRWIHFEQMPDIQLLADVAENVFVDISTKNRFKDQPLISIITPTHKSGHIIFRTYQSLVSQQYSNWEWILIDDSPDDSTWSHLVHLAKSDPRIRAYKPHQHTGNIGALKRQACGLSYGQIFVELDHDDELTVNCLSDIVEAYNKYPDAGFYYSDCVEVFPDGSSNKYPEGWGLGYGSYREEDYLGKTYNVTNYPPINKNTLKHIVGAPNHVRAWKSEAYWMSGGHSPHVHVCDDYELIIRTFLATKFVHIKRLGYIQYIGSGQNTQTLRNAEIQRLVKLFINRYYNDIENKFKELGIDDDSSINYVLD